MAFPPLRKSDNVFGSVFIDFLSNSQWEAPFDHIGLITPVFMIIRELFHGRISARKFCEWVQVGIDVYIPHCKYQVKRHSYIHSFQLLVLLP